MICYGPFFSNIRKCDNILSNIYRISRLFLVINDAATFALLVCSEVQFCYVETLTKMAALFFFTIFAKLKEFYFAKLLALYGIFVVRNKKRKLALFVPGLFVQLAK